MQKSRDKTGSRRGIVIKRLEIALISLEIGKMQLIQKNTQWD